MSASPRPARKTTRGRLPWYAKRKTLWKHLQVYQDFVDRGLSVEDVMEVHDISRTTVYEMVSRVRKSGLHQGDWTASDR